MGIQAAANKILTFSDEDEVGGQTFNKFPEDANEVGQFWSEAWKEGVIDLAAPPIVVPAAVDATAATFASTMAGVATVPGGGIAAMDAAALAAFPGLAAAIAPNLIITPPASPLAGFLAAQLAAFLPAGTTDPIAPALAWGNALALWFATATWSAPGPPAPAPFALAP